MQEKPEGNLIAQIQKPVTVDNSKQILTLLYLKMMHIISKKQTQSKLLKFLRFRHLKNSFCLDMMIMNML